MEVIGSVSQGAPIPGANGGRFIILPVIEITIQLMFFVI